MKIVITDVSSNESTLSIDPAFDAAIKSWIGTQQKPEARPVSPGDPHTTIGQPSLIPTYSSTCEAVAELIEEMFQERWAALITTTEIQTAKSSLAAAESVKQDAVDLLETNRNSIRGIITTKLSDGK